MNPKGWDLTFPNLVGRLMPWGFVHGKTIGDHPLKRRILVTGGAGFIGSNITDLLVCEGFDVTVVDNLSTGKRENLNPQARFYQCDITSDELHSVIDEVRPECVIHHAAQIDVRRSVTDPAMDAQVNIVGSINLLEACRRSGVRKVIYSSSAALYGDPQYLPVDEDHPVLPNSQYGVSKHAVEHYLSVYRSVYGLEYTVLRYANVYGPRQDPQGDGGVAAIFTHRVKNGQVCTIFGDGHQTRDFVYVRDVARANLLALDRGDGMILNVGSQHETSITELVHLLSSVLDRDVDVDYSPERAGEVSRSVLSNARIKEALGWEPHYDLYSGIRDLLVSDGLTLSRAHSNLGPGTK